MCPGKRILKMLRFACSVAIIKNYFGPTFQACLIVNVSSEPKSLHETLSTLLFGANARQIALGPAKAHIYQAREATS
ncbi:unnamed protein product [Dibothriocephalus latus]|uniref:Kinesin motor domain-containing protein n=1 Tax=Dibothriocephalus latus TaxID=60516 RepID=A0A3P7LS43_DIBLA|nr:unnamed protein product [Dibothriocephalus latus]